MGFGKGDHATRSVLSQHFFQPCLFALAALVSKEGTSFFTEMETDVSVGKSEMLDGLIKVENVLNKEISWITRACVPFLPRVTLGHPLTQHRIVFNKCGINVITLFFL